MTSGVITRGADMAKQVMTARLEGSESVMAALRKLSDARGRVKAGVTEGAANDNGKDVLAYAPVQEFGGHIPVTDKMRGFLAANYGIHLRKDTTHITIPPRSFLRTTLQEKGNEWVTFLGRALNAGRKPEDALELVGGRMQDDIIAKINSNMPPPNSAATNFIKQQDAPAAMGKTLQHTGTLIHSINYEVEK